MSNRYYSVMHLTIEFVALSFYKNMLSAKVTSRGRLTTRERNARTNRKRYKETTPITTQTNK